MNIPFTPPLRTMADLLHRLGDVSPDRVRFNPVPGTATVDDLLKPENDGCELVDGTLVKKTMGLDESWFAAVLIELIGPFVRRNNLGLLSGGDGPFEMLSGLVRLPDVAFISWDRLPGRRRLRKPIPNVVPDLAVEVLSRNNRPREVARKRREYFSAGVRLVWEVNQRRRTVVVYTSLTSSTTLTAADTLDGGDVLPGFTLSLAELFADLDRHG